MLPSGMIKKLLLFCVGLSSVACTDGRNEIDTERPHTGLSGYKLDYFGSPALVYKLIRDDLYESDDRHLYFRTSEVIGSSASEMEFSPVYLKKLGAYNSDFPERVDPYLVDVVDKDSWRQVFDTIYSDRTNVFCRHDLSSGARLYWLKDFQIADSRFIFVRGGVVPNLPLDLADPTSSIPMTRWFLTNGDMNIDYRCRRVTDEDMKKVLQEQIDLNPPDYSEEIALPIK